MASSSAVHRLWENYDGAPEPEAREENGEEDADTNHNFESNAGVKESTDHKEPADVQDDEISRTSESLVSDNHPGLLEWMREGAVRLRHQAQVIEQRRINRLRIGHFAVERDQVVTAVTLRELDEEGADEEIQEFERDRLVASDRVHLLEKHFPPEATSADMEAEGSEVVDSSIGEVTGLQASDGLSESVPASPQSATANAASKPYSKTLPSLGASGASRQMRWVLEHRYFTYSVSAVVVLNALFIFLDEEYTASRRLGEQWAAAWEPFLRVSDIIFITLFCLEVGIRLYVERLAFFCQVWNLLDFSLVIVEITSNIFSVVSHSPGPAWFRIFRLGRLLWLLHLFESLWIIIVGVTSAMRTIGWAFIMLFIILYCFGILCTKMIGQSLINDGTSVDPDDAQLLSVWFGSIPESMFTLFTIMTMEGWAEIARTVAIYYELWTSLLACVVFFSLTTWGLMNMVVAVIIDATVGKALHHLENYVKITAAERHAAIKKICDCFFLTGVGPSGLLTRQQFLVALEDKNFVNRLHDVGIDVRQAHTLFDLLDFDKSGALNLHEFTEGVLEARGSGHAMDVLRLKYDLQRCSERTKASMIVLKHGLDTPLEDFMKEARALNTRLAKAVHDTGVKSAT